MYDCREQRVVMDTRPTALGKEMFGLRRRFTQDGAIGKFRPPASAPQKKFLNSWLQCAVDVNSATFTESRLQ